MPISNVLKDLYLSRFHLLKLHIQLTIQDLHLHLHLVLHYYHLLIQFYPQYWHVHIHFNMQLSLQDWNFYIHLFFQDFHLRLQFFLSIYSCIFIFLFRVCTLIFGLYLRNLILRIFFIIESFSFCEFINLNWLHYWMFNPMTDLTVVCLVKFHH